MDVKTILIILALNIGLPNLDTLTDINLILKLYRGSQCKYPSQCEFRYRGHPERDDYEKCWFDPDGYCSNDENNLNVCDPYHDNNERRFKKCREDPDGYCSNDENNQNVCRFSPHYKMATAMLIPFLLNCVACFITFLRKEKNKKFTIIFALLPFYILPTVW